jgi:pimeloyl-ACP methyl ester carboxylesterase
MSGDDCIEARLSLPDGRRIGYRESGDPLGQPLFFFHGLPGSRFQCPDEGDARERGVRLIAPERPGFGLSDPVSEPYPLAAWARDVGAVAGLLGIERFTVVGYSLGGMYALACASALPQRVVRLGLISSAAPLDVPGNWEGMGGTRAFYDLARYDPAALAGAAEPLMSDPATFLDALAGNACEVDQCLFAAPALRDRFLRDAREVLRGDLHAPLRDLLLCTHPWGFELASIRTPAMLWHGLDDISAPPAMARYLASTLPDCRARLYPCEGHLLLFSRWPEILSALAG